MNNLLYKLMLGSSTVALVAATSLSGAMAQGDSDIEQVVVSASRISIAGYTQPTPVTVIGAAQLEKNAYTNIVDSLNAIPQMFANPSSISASQNSTFGGNSGGDTLNLRALGVNRTLVLIDGQRMAANGTGGGASYDINSLPTTLISRVDIVTGGASAAWGSDAVAGVVNFIINKNYSGFKATISGGDTADGLDRNISVNAAWGDDTLGGRNHFLLSGSATMLPDFVVLGQEKWYRGAYWVSNPAYVAGNSQPQLIVANNVGSAILTFGGIINASPAGTSAAANALRGIEFVGAGIPQLVNYGNLTLGAICNNCSLDGNNGGPTTPVAGPRNTFTLFGYDSYKLTDTIQASVMLNWMYSHGKNVTNGGQQTALTIHSDNAYIPASVKAVMTAGGITSFTLGTYNYNNVNPIGATGATLAAQYSAALGPNFEYSYHLFARGVFTLQGTIGNDWFWNAYAQSSETRFWGTILGNPILANQAAAEDAVTVTTANRGTSNLPLGSIACRSSLPGQAAVVQFITAQPGCVPLNVFGNGVASPAAIAYIIGRSNGTLDHGDAKIEQDVVEGSMQGTLPWQLPAGKVAVAFGTSYRKEATRQLSDAVSLAGGFANSNWTNTPDMSYTVLEGFGEVDGPILKDNIVKSLDFTMAGRMTSYSTSGLVETWKLGLTSQVNDDFKLRTTWSVDIRAPNLSELFSPGSRTAGTQRDPKTQLIVPVQPTTIGNPNLVPENARTISGGVVLTPSFISGLTMSVDWYSIHLTKEIGTIAQASILAQCNATLPSVLQPGQNGNPNDPLCTHLVFNGPNGALSELNNQPLNIANVTTSGLDVSADYSMDFWDGTLSWSSLTSLNDEFTSDAPGTPTNDNAGSENTNGAANAPGPKWRGTLGATYTAGPYSFTAQTRWFGTNIITNLANTGNLTTPSQVNLYDPHYFEIPFIAYFDLRGSYKWNDNIEFSGGIDNVFDNPPGLLPNSSSTNPCCSAYTTNITLYPMTGRSFRAVVRFNY